MKLLHCMACHDVLALHYKARKCKCKRSTGRYVDDIHVEYSGPACIIGMLNSDLRFAQAGLKGELSPEYKWWVIPDHTGRVKKVDP